MDPRDETFALLDDREATIDRPLSRLYTDFVVEHRCGDSATLDTAWARIDADLRRGLHAVVMADYEWGARLLGTGRHGPAPDGGALRVLLFRTLHRLSRDQADAWLAGRERVETGQAAGSGGVAAIEGPGPAGLLPLRASVDRAAFDDAIGRIHEAIRAGETYQVNYTYRLDGMAHGHPVALYRRLRAHQPVRYGALIAMPCRNVAEAGGPAGSSDEPPEACAERDTVERGGQGTRHVLSCSPELFLRHAAGRLTARPMKGTASRAASAESDSETARLLSEDVKNRAENLMIVDLLRNDLGRIARIGSVRVPELFRIEPYATVFQMTSTVEATLRPEVDFPSVLRAAFPCGSITGAPKHHTMDLIAGLETTPRGLYCGALGWIDPPAGPDVRIGDFCLSVTIRTLTLAPPVEHGVEAGLRPVRLGVGAGIVLDSVAADEYEECRLKARFATALDPGFELFETMHASRAAGVRHLDRHLARLTRSAQALGFRLDAAALRVAIEHALATLPDAPACRLRIALAHDGRIDTRSAPLPPLPTPADRPVALLVAPERLGRHRPLAGHKTTDRALYDLGVSRAEAEGAFDSLYFDQDDRLVEGGRSTVFVRLDGRWATPPLSDGALPGVMREVALRTAAFDAVERSVSRSDLDRAEGLKVCNALRGLMDARLHQQV